MQPFDENQRNLLRSTLDNEDILSGHFWGELRVFLAVAKAKSFNRAAEILNTSQPTVSRQVKRLQSLMGSQLFVPTKKGVALTDKGQALAEALSKLDHSLFSLANDLKSETRKAEGIVRLSITDGLNTFFVAPSLASFTAANPRIQLHLKSPANVVSLRDNQTDMMIGFIPADGPDISQRELGRLHFLPVVAKSYIERYGLPTRTNLEDHLFLQSEFYSAKTGLWSGWNHAVARGRIAHYCDNSVAYGMLVKAGLGIGLLGSYTILEPTAIPLDLEIHASVRLYAMALTERLNAKPVRIAFDWISDMFGPSNPWFSDEFRLGHVPSQYDAGIRMLFNI